MAQLFAYSPLQLKTIFKGVEATGYKKDSFIKVKRKNPIWSEPQVSADGTTATRVQSLDNSGTIEITLEAASPTNKAFANIVASDKLHGDGVGTASVRDLNGNDKHTASQAYLAGPPDPEYGASAGDRMWTIHCVDLDVFCGGSVQ